MYNSFPNYYKYCKHLPLCCATPSPPVVVSNLLRSTTKLIALNSTQPKVTNFFHIFETGVCLIKRSIWTYENTVGSENLTLLTAKLTVRGSKCVRDFPKIVQNIKTTEAVLKFTAMEMLRYKNLSLRKPLSLLAHASLFKIVQRERNYLPFISGALCNPTNESEERRRNIGNMFASKEKASHNLLANQRLLSCRPACCCPISYRDYCKLYWRVLPHIFNNLNSRTFTQSGQSLTKITSRPASDWGRPSLSTDHGLHQQVSMLCLPSFSIIVKMYLLFVLQLSTVVFSFQFTQPCHSSKAMLTSVVVISNSITTYEITVYDTTGTINPTGSSPNLRTLSLREVSSCDDIVTQYYPPSLDNFEVLRRVSEPIINVLTCQYLATLTVKYCGWDGLQKYAYGAKPVYRERQIRVSKGICLSLFHGEPVNFQIEG